MWKLLKAENLIAAYRKEAEGVEKHVDALAALLETLSSRPWASDVFAVTSLGHLRLTTGSYLEQEKHGCLFINALSSCEVGLTYCAPHHSEPDADIRCGFDQAPAKIELLLIRLFKDREKAPPDQDSTDDNPKSPRLEVGDSVSVVLGEHNRTPHTGTIHLRVWHHKLRCWHYYLEENGKKVKKRYCFRDLRPI